MLTGRRNLLLYAPALNLLLALGCAQTSVPDIVAPVEGQSLADRAADDPIGWHLGDRKPVARSVEAWESHRCTGKTCPIELGTTLRNRCLGPVHIQVGPNVATPPNTAPSHTVAAGEAIWWLKSREHHIYIADSGRGTFKRPPAAATTIVISGDACEQIDWE